MISDKKETKAPIPQPAYFRMNAIGATDGTIRPMSEGVAYCYTKAEWDALRNVQWENLKAYVQDEFNRRVISKAKEKVAKAQAAVVALEKK